MKRANQSQAITEKEAKTDALIKSAPGVRPPEPGQEIFGYVRVSTIHQAEDRQLLKMSELGVPEDHVFVDKVSGKNFDRPEYKRMSGQLHKGSLLYIDSIDRLGRSWRDTVNEWTRIVHDVGADISVLTENQSFLDSRKFREMGEIGEYLENCILSILSFVADLERANRATYQAEGIRIAKLQGKHLGRPALPSEKKDKIFSMASEKLYNIEQVSKMTGIPLLTVVELKEKYILSRSPDSLTELCKKKNIERKNAVYALQFLSAPRYSQKDIAKELGVSITTVRNYLTGKIK